MSVEKIISHEDVPFTQICNHVIQNISNIEAGFVWIYLYSKSANWKVIKEHIKNKFNINDKKLKKIFSYLVAHRLIEYITHRDKKGIITKWEIRVLNGSKFLTDQQVKELSTEVSKNVHPLVPKPTPVDIHTGGKEELLNKDNTKERKSTKERESALKKSFCPGVHEMIISDEAIKIANDKKLDITKLAYAFMDYAKSHGWLRDDWKSAFVKWVRDERVYNENLVKINLNEPRSTVKEYGPGHPDWERMNDWKKQQKYLE